MCLSAPPDAPTSPSPLPADDPRFDADALAADPDFALWCAERAAEAVAHQIGGAP